MVYLQLFISFLKVGFLGFGGGMAIISLIQREVEEHHWMTQTEFVDIVGISQVTPGPIGMNCATYVGYTATGTIWGSLLASFAIVVPSIIIMGIVCYIYDRIRDRWNDNKAFQITMRIIRCLVVVLVAHAAYTLMTADSFVDIFSWIIFSVVVVCTLLPMAQKNKVIDIISHPILLICLAGLVGYILY